APTARLPSLTAAVFWVRPPGKTFPMRHLRALRFCIGCATAILLVGCGGGGGGPNTPLPSNNVVINGPSGLLDTGASRQFTASVSGTSDMTVAWSVTRSGGGTITTAGLYTAPALPSTYTVKATAHADGTRSATVAVPVVIPEGHVAGYDVGVDYHATGTDFINTAFISQYDT